MSPQGDTLLNTDGTQVAQFSYAALGARLELNAHIAFGARMEHVLGFQIGVNAYSPAFSGPADDMMGIAAGLDSAGVLGYVGVGYTYRFNTPLGRAALVTLE